MFWSEIGSGLDELGSTPPKRIPRSTPRGVVTNLWLLSSVVAVVVDGISGSSNTSGSLGLLLLIVVLLK